MFPGERYCWYHTSNKYGKVQKESVYFRQGRAMGVKIRSVKQSQIFAAVSVLD